MSKKVFNSSEDALKHYKELTEYRFKAILQERGVFIETILSDDKETLKQKEEIISKVLSESRTMHRYRYAFRSEYDFDLLNSEYDQTRFYFTFEDYLKKTLEKIRERINYLEQTDKVESIKELVGALPENETKDKLKNEIHQLELKKAELEAFKIDERERLSNQIELGKHKVEMFEMKTNLFLKFLDRESVASIIGSILLFLMGVCLLVMMFLQKEPIKIVESAFLLILGYFFGHSKKQ